MDKERSVELLQEILEIYSPSGKETQISTFLFDKFKELNFRNVRKNKIGNVYGEVGSGSPTVVLCGHMDTVAGRISVRKKDDYLYGRGAVDAKSSLAAMISAASNLIPNVRKGRIVVAAVVEEERKGTGVRHLIKDVQNVDYALFGEPSGLRNITFAYKGHIRLKVTCKTETGHIGAQHLLANAIKKSFELWVRLEVLGKKHSSQQGIFYSFTPSLVGIKSQRTSGGLPDVCVLDIDMRLPPKIKCDDALELTEKTMLSFQSDFPTVSLTLHSKGCVEPYVAKRDSVVMEALQTAVREITGEPARFIRKTGTGDMNIFGAEKEIPVATYGPGNSLLSHSRNEYIQISEYLVAVQIYTRAIEEMLTKGSSVVFCSRRKQD